MAKWDARVSTASDGDRAAPARNPAGNPAGGSGARGPVDRDLRGLMESARGLLQAGKFDEAISAFENVLERNPHFAPAYYGVGNAHFRKGNLDDALEYYSGALHINKEMPEALMAIGSVLVRKEQHTEALKKFQEALALNPSLTRAHLSLARIFLKLNQIEDAQAHLDAAYQQNPQLAEVGLLRANLAQQRGDVEQAIALLREALEKDAEAWQARMRLGRLYLKEQRAAEAVETLQAAVEVKPEAVLAHVLLARACREAKSFDAALGAVDRALALDATHQGALLERARIYLDQERLEEARRTLVTLTMQPGNLALVHRLLAQVCLGLGRHGEAVAEYQAALFHGKHLGENDPHLLTIASLPIDDREKAEAYRQAFAEIGESSGQDMLGNDAFDPS